MRWRALLAAVGVVLSGCALIGGPEVEPLSPGEQLPLEALVPSGSASSRRAEFDRYQVLLQECMAAEGFEYYTVPMDTEVEIGSLPSDELADYATQQGYGLTEQLLPGATALDAVRAGVLPYYVEFDLSEFGIIETEPNVLYAMSLTPEEADAYLIALEGPDPDHQTSPPDYGCQGRVGDQVDAENRSAVEVEPEWLDEAIQRIDERIMSATAEYASVEMLWADCMAEHGFTEFAERIDAPESIRLGILELVLESAALTDELAPTAIAQLHEREMVIAAADAQCYSTVYLPLSRGIEARIQTEVLADLGVISGD